MTLTSPSANRSSASAAISRTNIAFAPEMRRNFITMAFRIVSHD
jgi:hypothetical protein